MMQMTTSDLQDVGGSKSIKHTALVASFLVVAGMAAVATVSTIRHEVHVLLMLVLIFIFAPAIDVLTSQIKFIKSMPIGSTYTCWNDLLVTYAIIDHVMLGRPPLLLPYLVINSWAIAAAFNVVRLCDRTFWERAAAWSGFPLSVFHVFNVLVHLLPAVYCTWWFTQHPAGACSASSMSMPWLITIAFHGSWVLRTVQTIFLDEIYFECPKWQWCLAWASALAVHILVGRGVSLHCRASTSQWVV